MLNKKRPDYDELYDLYCIQKQSTNDIAKRFNTTNRTISKWLKYYKIETWFAAIKRPDKDTLHRWYWTEKKTLPEIAQICGCSYPAVRYWFRKFGLLRRTNSEAQTMSHGTDKLTKEELERLYYTEGWHQSKIAKHYGLTQSSIKDWMKRFGIKARKGNYGKVNGMFGRTHTPEAREKIRQANRRQFSDPQAREAHALTTIKQIQEGRTGKAYNSLEQTVAKLLDEAGTAYNQQYRIGRFLFDFYLPESITLIEVHGRFWHADPRFYGDKELTKIQKRNTANDIRKAERAKKDGYRLVILWEDDITNGCISLANL